MVVTMEQRNSTCHAFGPRYSTDKDGGCKWQDGNPIPTRTRKGEQRNGPRRRSSRLRVLSSAPSGAPIDPRHPEISGGLRRDQRRDRRHWHDYRHFKARNTITSPFLRGSAWQWQVGCGKTGCQNRQAGRRKVEKKGGWWWERRRRAEGSAEALAVRGTSGSARVTRCRNSSVLSLSLAWAEQGNCHEPLELSSCEKAQ